MRNGARRRQTSFGPTMANLVVAVLLVALLVSILLSAGPFLPGAAPLAEAPSPAPGVLPSPSPRPSPTPTSAPLVVLPTPLPTPSPSDVSVQEDAPKTRPDGSYELSGHITNRNKLWALDIVQAPSVAAIDSNAKQAATVPVHLSSSRVPPGGSVSWSAVVPSVPGRVITSFQRSQLVGHWSLPSSPPPTPAREPGPRPSSSPSPFATAPARLQ